MPNSDDHLDDDSLDDLIKTLVPWYLQQELNNVCLLEQALSDRDFGLLISGGDKIYGHGSTFGFKQISLLGKRIEIAAINRDIVLLADSISTLRTYVLEQIKSLNIDLDGK